MDQFQTARVDQFQSARIICVSPEDLLATGSGHTCAIDWAGGVKCWGVNNAGQLGDGTTASHQTPGSVPTLTSGVVSLAANAADHTCAVTASGEVKCWGFNFTGQVGDGTTTNKLSPASVVTLTGNVSTATAQNAHTCVLMSTGGAKCWGNNSFAELGNGTTTNSSTPVDVTGLTGLLSVAKPIAAGAAHTCAVASTGLAKCWGTNSLGQLGDGTTTTRPVPVQALGDAGFKSIAAGNGHTCAVTSEGDAKCWGGNADGQLGDGTTTSRAVPGDVAGLPWPTGYKVKAISAGNQHSCAITVAGRLMCWGYNSAGQLGDGTTTTRLWPVDVSGLQSGVVGVAVGHRHTCAVLGDGGVKCWGSNQYGQLGDGTTVNRLVPIDVPGL